MMMKVDDHLNDYIKKEYEDEAERILGYFPSFDLNPNSIKAVMINEIVADSPEDDFYSMHPSPYYMQTTIPLFENAGRPISGIQDIINMGIYITSAVKIPKENTKIETETIKHYMPLLKKELEIFPNLKAIMLMGDVAKKAVNMIAKSETKKNAVPAGSTYKIRHMEFEYNGIRLLPAYIMTGKNLLIEKSKMTMSAEEMAKMFTLIGA